MSNVKKTADEIADALGEKQYGPRKLVRAVVEQCGVEFALVLLQDTDEVMAAGGMLTAIADRVRTKGGVFFYLARGRMADDTRDSIFPPHIVRSRRKEEMETAHLPDFDWAERAAIIHPLLDKQGEASTVNISLIGHPGQVEIRKDVVITTMTHASGAPTLPRGVPPLPETPTIYTVYISLRQWKRVEDTIANDPEDPLVIDGICAFDPELQTVTVHATQVTTRALEIEKKMAQGTNNGTPETRRTAPPPPTPAKTVVSVPEGAPADVAQKLRDLYAAVDLYRQKIATIENKPADQRFGLEMTQKLLRNVEGEIAMLEKQYA